MKSKKLGKDFQTLIQSDKGRKKIDTYIVYKNAVKSALFDSVISSDEVNMLEGLANTLNLNPRESDIIFKEAKQEHSVEIIKTIKQKETQPKTISDEQKENRRLNIENKALRLEIACLRVHLHDQVDEDHENERDVHYLNNRICHLEEINTELEKMLEVDKVKISKLASHRLKSPVLKKTVICTNCKAERNVEVIHGCPSILTCSTCGQKYLVNA